MIAGSGSNPAVGSIYAGHTYASAGTYPITLTVNDGAGHTVTTSLNADVAVLQYVVPGLPGQTVTISFDKADTSAGFDNSVGLFDVSAANGTINGIAPGQSGYPSAALTFLCAFCLMCTHGSTGSPYVELGSAAQKRTANLPV